MGGQKWGLMDKTFELQHMREKYSRNPYDIKIARIRLLNIGGISCPHTQAYFFCTPEKSSQIDL